MLSAVEPRIRPNYHYNIFCHNNNTRHSWSPVALLIGSVFFLSNVIQMEHIVLSLSVSFYIILDAL